MPVKKIVMVRRRADLTPEQFRDGYENSHSRIAVELFGHHRHARGVAWQVDDEDRHRHRGVSGAGAQADGQPRTKAVTSGSSPTCRLQWPCTAGSNAAPAGSSWWKPAAADT